MRPKDTPALLKTSAIIIIALIFIVVAIDCDGRGSQRSKKSTVDEIPYLALKWSETGENSFPKFITDLESRYRVVATYKTVNGILYEEKRYFPASGNNGDAAELTITIPLQPGIESLSIAIESRTQLRLIFARDEVALFDTISDGYVESPVLLDGGRYKYRIEKHRIEKQ